MNNASRCKWQLRIGTNASRCLSPSPKNVPKIFGKFDSVAAPSVNSSPNPTSSPSRYQRRPTTNSDSVLRPFTMRFSLGSHVLMTRFTNHRVSLRVKKKNNTFQYFLIFSRSDVAKSRAAIKFRAYFLSDVRYIPLYIYSDTCVFVAVNVRPRQQAQPTSEACHVCA